MTTQHCMAFGAFFSFFFFGNYALELAVSRVTIVTYTTIFDTVEG